MVTINVEQKTKERFKKKKLEHSVEISKEINEDDFINILLDEFESKKK